MRASDGRIAGLAACALCLVAPSAAAITPDTVWNSAAREALPSWVQVWIYSMFLIFGAGLAFVRKHPSAWWMVGAFAASHLGSGLERILLGPERLTVGMIAINHCIFWTPAAVCFVATTRETPLTTPFGTWRVAVIGAAVFSLLFDYRDAAAYLRASC